MTTQGQHRTDDAKQLAIDDSRLMAKIDAALLSQAIVNNARYLWGGGIDPRCLEEAIEDWFRKRR